MLERRFISGSRMASSSLREIKKNKYTRIVAYYSVFDTLIPQSDSKLSSASLASLIAALISTSRFLNSPDKPMRKCEFKIKLKNEKIVNYSQLTKMVILAGCPAVCSWFGRNVYNVKQQSIRQSKLDLLELKMIFLAKIFSISKQDLIDLKPNRFKPDHR